MRMVSVAIIGAILLLLSGIFVWNAEASPLSGLVGVQPDTRSITMVGCEEADDLCGIGKEMICTPGGPDPQCACNNCEANVTVRCPRYPACNCNPGTVCPGLAGGSWCYCPR